jgi:uncharacterized membrane protein
MIMRRRVSIYLLSFWPRISLIYLLALLAMGAGGLASCGKQPEVVQGTVTQAQDGKPVAQATVRIFQLTEVEGTTNVNVFQKGDVLQTLLADEKGAYSVSLLPGNYVIEVQAEGLQTKSSLVEVKQGETTTRDFSLAAPSP